MKYFGSSLCAFCNPPFSLLLSRPRWGVLFYYFNALFVFYVSILFYRNIFFMQPAAFPPLLFLRLASKPPWTEEPSRLQSMGSIRVRHERLHFHFHFHALEKEMATHSSVLAWRIPGTGEPGGLPSMWLHRVGHD